MKKILICCSILVLSLFSTGCASTIDLTDEQNEQIAEYAAELILKYSKNYDSKYYGYEDDSQYTTVEPVTTEIITTEATATESTDTDAVSTTSTEGVTTTEEVISQTSDFDIGSVVDEDILSIIYSDYCIVSEYPSYDSDGVYVNIEAPEGYKLLVLSFSVTNHSAEDYYVDLYSKDVQYKLVMNGSRIVSPMLTILLEDLYTYQMNVRSGETANAVLLFQLVDAATENIDSLELTIDYGGNDTRISID